MSALDLFERRERERKMILGWGEGGSM